MSVELPGEWLGLRSRVDNKQEVASGLVVAHVSASAIAHNLRLLRGCLAPSTRLCAPVKADCYGHGLSLLAPTIVPFADMLAVTLPDEALAVRHLGITKPVLSFLSACSYAEGAGRDEAIAELIARDIIQTIASPEEIPLIGCAARRLEKQAEIHVKVDTGMGRCGVCARDATALVQQAVAEPGLKVTGIYSHFATTHEKNSEFAREQLACFEQVLAECDGAKGLIRHMANSPATINLPEAHFDMVRPGVAMYGCQPAPEMARDLPLRPAIRVTSRLLPVKNVPAGASCGYGLTYTFDRPSRVACVPVGYADGYFRCLSNQTTAAVRGVDAPIRGQVSMDLVVLDITDAPDARMGDAVELVSDDPASPRSVANLARLAGTIPQEVLCRLGSRIRRVLVD